MKGFMFSIEAAIAIISVLLLIGATAFITEQKQPTSNYGQIKAQSEMSMKLYFNEPGNNSNTFSKEEYCEKFPYFNTTTSLISEKNSCWVVK